MAFNFADFGRGDSHASMKETDVDVTPAGDLRFTFVKDKTGSTRLLPRDFFWPQQSLPELIALVKFWLDLRTLFVSMPGYSKHMWRLPWESSRFTAESLRKVFAKTLASLGVFPPPGRKYTLHCVRAGAASAANALDISLPKIRRFGGWSLKSDVPLDYIDPACPYSAAAQRFFGWIRPPSHSPAG